MTDRVAQIRRFGWRQGSVFPRSLAAEVAMQGFGDGDGYLVLSQDCDVVHRSLETEAKVELIAFEPVVAEAVYNSLRHAKNPRQLVVACTAGHWFRFDVRRRCLVDRELLAESPPEADPKFDAQTIGQLARWVAKRYTRAAFPDAFNERLRAGESAIKKALKRHGQHASSLYIQLDPQGECGEGETYRLILVILSAAGVMNDEAVELELAELQSALEVGLSKCAGIDLEDSRLLGEDEFSLHDLRTFQRWDFDARSYSGEPGGEIAPDP